ncbi:MAG TPA: hypothetical protein VN657_13805, partial [Nitrospiraceae bacterium]|nr:hypothetical protein [Nitrospiraceae bacterium]
QQSNCAPVWPSYLVPIRLLSNVLASFDTHHWQAEKGYGPSINFRSTGPSAGRPGTEAAYCSTV